MLAHGKKRVADCVRDNIVASVLGVNGWPQPNGAAVVRAAVDAFREARMGTDLNCLVREVVNGAVKASQFTQLSVGETARATMQGVVQGAALAGWSLPPIVRLACERLLWSTAALGEKLPACARGTVEGATNGAARLHGEHARIRDLVAASALCAVQEIDETQVEATRHEIAAALDKC